MIRIILSTILLLSFILNSKGEKGFTNDASSSWIDFNKEYHKLYVSKTGIQKVLFQSLPAQYKSSRETLELWHRGKQIRFIDVTEEGFTFYGEVNDGSSDSLLFRPYSARLNIYESLFSDKGAYFLTIGGTTKKSKTQKSNAITGTIEPFHLEKKVKLFKDQYGFLTITSPGTSLNQSYYTSANTWTGPSIASIKPFSESQLDTLLKEKIQLEELKDTEKVPISLELLLTGMHQGAHSVNVEMVSNDKSTLLGVKDFVGWESVKYASTISNNLIDRTNNQFEIRLRTTTQSNFDWFSLTYYKVVYPQEVKLNKDGEKVFYFPPTNNSLSRIQIANVLDNTSFFDISDPYNVQVLTGKVTNGVWEGMVERSPGIELKLYAVTTDNIKTIVENHKVIGKAFYTSQVVGQVENLKTSLSKFNYFIITYSGLRDGAVEYAKYRESDIGGGYKVMVVDVKDIYDIYNYGEVSPVAIKHFTSQIARSTPDLSNHHVFLIGRSVTYPTFITKELPEEVPSIGDPGSDILLVSGLNNTPEDYPSMAIGRLKVFNSSQVVDYLNKVRKYESETDNLGWKKDILHMSGGHSQSELITLESILKGLAPYADNSKLGANVIPLVKKGVNDEKVDISKQVNGGVGMLTYFGHGSQTVLDFDFGYISDPARGFTDTERYAFMYFNGCGVGNIFTSRNRWILSDDWLGTANKGAVNILANSYLSYVSTSARHLTEFYSVLFKRGNESLTIGQVTNITARNVLKSNPNIYDIANIHQMVLQGDPAVKLFQLNDPDYTINEYNGVHLYSKDKLSPLSTYSDGNLAINVQNNGAYIIDENTSISVDLYYKGNKIVEKSVDISSFPFKNDTIWISVEDIQNLTNIVVKVDPNEIVTESNELNNRVEVLIDWEEITNDIYYPNTPQIDIIAPQIQLLLNGQIPVNKIGITEETTFTIVIDDDRLLNDDVSGTTVFLKECWERTCSYIPYSLQGAQIIINEDRKKLITFRPPLNAGDYEILIRSVDLAGNTTHGDYTLQFKVLNESVLEENTVTIYPNPASEYLVINMTKSLTISDLVGGDYELINLQGQSVLQGQLSHNAHTYIQLQNSITPGTYFLKLNLIDKERNKTLIKRLIVN